MLDATRIRQVRPRRGVTMLELVFVLAIATVILAIAGPRMTNSIANRRADAAAHQIVSDIDFARAVARAKRVATEVVYDLDAETVDVNPTEVVADVDPKQTDLDAVKSKLDVVDFGGSTTLTFDSFGNPSAAGSITVTSGSATRIVDVDINGKATIR